MASDPQEKSGKEKYYGNWPHIITASHEAGHAVFLYNLLPFARVLSVEARANRPSAGFVAHHPWMEDRGPYYHAWQALAGRAAERIAANCYCDGTDLPPFDADRRDHFSYDDYVVAFRMLRPGQPVPPPDAMNDDRRIVRELGRVSEWLWSTWDQVHDLTETLIFNGRLSGADVESVLEKHGPPKECAKLHRYALCDRYRINATYWSTPARMRRDLLSRGRPKSSATETSDRVAA
jgi:hypothetical protein